jgi:hypothetical protein
MRDRGRGAHGIVLALALGVGGCRDEAGSPVQPSARQSAMPAPSSATAPAPGLSPLGGAEWLERLPVAGFADARVSVPLGATEARPVMIGAHGKGDRPEWACGEWRGVTHAHPFIVCPHGSPRDAGPGAGLSFADAETTLREIRGGIAAVRARFGVHVADGPVVYAGFSLGAIVGARMALAEPALFPFLVLAEGGHAVWTAESVARFAAGGGRGVLFVCSTAACEVAATPLLARFRSAGVEAQLVSAGRIGHVVDDRVVEAIRPGFRWLVRDVPEYAPWLLSAGGGSPGAP